MTNEENGATEQETPQDVPQQDGVDVEESVGVETE